jgi:hypothetical protein
MLGTGDGIFSCRANSAILLVLGSMGFGFLPRYGDFSNSPRYGYRFS